MKFSPAFALVALTLLAGCSARAPLYPSTAAQAIMQRSAVTAGFKPHAAAPANFTEHFAQVSPFLMRGGMPNDEQMQKLKDMGVTVDVNLQGAGSTEKPIVAHEAEVMGKLGITFVNIPIPFNVALPAEMPEKFLAIVESEAKLTDHCVYVHCTHGRDRTGTMVSYYRMMHDHWSFDQALTEQRSFGFKPKDYPTFVAFLQGLEK